MNPIFRALAQGYGVDQILEHVTKLFPKAIPRIKQAQQMGYNASQILNFLSDKMETEFADKYMTSNAVDAARKRQYKQQMQEVAKMGLNLGTTALSAYALGKVVPAVMSRLNPAQKQALQKQIQQPQQQIQKQPSTPNQIPTTQSQVPIQSNEPTSQIPEALPSPQQQTTTGTQPPSPPTTHPLEGLGNEIKTMAIGNKNSPDTIAAMLPFMGKIKKDQISKLEKETGQSFPDLVKDYLNKNPPEPERNLSEDVKPEAKPQPSFNTSVQLKNGETAQLENLHKNIAEIDLNGRKTSRNFNDLSLSSDEIKGLDIVIDPKKIPESEKSSNLGFVFHPPDRSWVSVMYGPSGEFYIYQNKNGQPIDEEILKKIEDGVTLPITTGKSYLGSWDANEADSRGTVMFHEIKNLAQSKDKPDDPSKPFVFQKAETRFITGHIKEAFRLLQQGQKAFNAAMKRENASKEPSKPLPPPKKKKKGNIKI